MWGTILTILSFVILAIGLLREERTRFNLAGLASVSKSGKLVLVIALFLMATGIGKSISDHRQQNEITSMLRDIHNKIVQTRDNTTDDTTAKELEAIMKQMGSLTTDLQRG